MTAHAHVDEVELRADAAGRAELALLPCPFCGSTNLRCCDIMYADDDGEHPGVECLDCDAASRLSKWNCRPCAA